MQNLRFLAENIWFWAFLWVSVLMPRCIYTWMLKICSHYLEDLVALGEDVLLHLGDGVAHAHLHVHGRLERQQRLVTEVVGQVGLHLCLRMKGSISCRTAV